METGWLSRMVGRNGSASMNVEDLGGGRGAVVGEGVQDIQLGVSG